MKIEISFDTLKRIAKTSPDLTMAQFVSVWNEKIAEEKREQDRDRKSGKPAETAGIATETAGKILTREEEEGALFAFARTICGPRCGGMVTDLLKLHHFDIAAVRAVFERARTTADPKAFIAATCRKQNGARTSPMAAVDQLIADEQARSGDGNGPLLDLKVVSSRTS